MSAPRLPEHAPLVIAGGGPVGATLALALKNSPARPVLLEARPAESARDDHRYLALSLGSQLILCRLGVWRELAPHATPINHIEVSQRGGFGRASLAASDVDLPALGYVVTLNDLSRVLSRALARDARCFFGAQVQDVRAVREFAIVECNAGGPHEISTLLAVIADGGRSLADKGGPLAPRVKDYGQWAVVTWIRTEGGHGNRAYERFTSDGPAALLPAGAGYSVVLTTNETDSEALYSVPDTEFIARLRDIFGARLTGTAATTERARFPLTLRYANRVTAERVAFIGNAAQTLHPVAGQGFNLGLRDAWTLAQLILRSPEEDLGSASMLARYRDLRARDRSTGILFTDTLVRVFSNSAPWLAVTRGLGLATLDFSNAPKRFLMRRMMFGA